MKTSPRLDQAITKLYAAFHGGQLNPECCKSCAVGNILDNTDTWKHLTERHGSMMLSYIGRLNEGFGRRINGYSPLELLKIEAEFLKGCGYALPLIRQSKRPKNPTDKEVLFNGLCATVAFLCELDGVENVMDYSRLFEFEEENPIYELDLPLV